MTSTEQPSPLPQADEHVDTPDTVEFERDWPVPHWVRERDGWQLWNDPTDEQLDTGRRVHRT